MALETVGYEVADRVATVTLNRPEKMNAWNGAMARDLSAAMAEARDDDAVRAIILTGAGRAFCAGLDLAGGAETFSRGSGDAGGAPQAEDRGEDRPSGGRGGANIPTLLPYDVPKPIIAAINGPAVGVGITYPMLCDVRIAAERATIGFVFVRRGVMPELASHAIVQRVVGFSNAADLLMSGRIITGVEAAQMGLVSQAVPKEELLDAARAKAAEYVKAAPVSVALTKRLLWEGMQRSAADMMQRENEIFPWLSAQADAREGVISFLEKREPEWQLSAARDLPEGV